MKKIILLITIVTSFFLLGCSDFLKEDNKSNPDAAVFYKTPSGYESLVNSCYSTLRDVYGDNVEMFVIIRDLHLRIIQLKHFIQLFINLSKGVMMLFIMAN